MDLISVIVNVNNCESYINECIESILKQTYNNLEILLVLNNASLNEEKICEYHKKNDKRIHIIENNKDNYKNIGINKAKGKYITFVNGYDKLNKEFIKYTYSKIKEVDADIIGVSLKKLNSDKSSLKYDVYEKDEILENYLKMNIRSTSDGKLYRKEILNGIIYPNCYYDDYMIIYDLLKKCNKIISSDIKYYIKRNNSIKITDKELLNKIDSSLSLVDKVEKEHNEYIDLCKVKVCYELIDLFRNLENTKAKKQVYKYIRIYRKYALNDKRFSYSKKTLVMRSLLGYNFMRLSFFLEDKI